MGTIIYEQGKESGEKPTYEIDELSQRLLVYLLIHGSASPNSLTNPIGADSKAEIESLYENLIGPEGAGLVRKREGNQTLDGDVVVELTLTDRGENFVYKHKNSLSMPADLEEVAETVSELQVELNDIRNRLENIEYQLKERDNS